MLATNVNASGLAPLAFTCIWCTPTRLDDPLTECSSSAEGLAIEISIDDESGHTSFAIGPAADHVISESTTVDLCRGFARNTP